MKPSNQRWSCDPEEALASDLPTPAKIWAFRLIAVGVPSAIGLTLVVWLLFQQERLAFDQESGGIVMQSRPIYLEEPGHEVTGHRYLYDADLGWRNIPQWRATTRGKTLTINSHGLRDKEYDYEKPTGCKRILVLGDSFAWGYGVSDDEIFTEVLENQLADNTNAIQVINTGVSGWGTDQEFLFLRNEGFRYDPDLVVLAFFLVNDPGNNVNSRQYGLNKPVFADIDLTLLNTPVPKPFEFSEIVNSAADPIDMTVAIIGEMSTECVARSIPLVFMKFGLFLRPHEDQLRELDENLSERLRTAAPELSILDLDQEFATRGTAAAELLKGNDDGHWNAYGHALTADILRGFLESENLIAE